MSGSGFRVPGSGFRVPGSRFRVPGSRFRVPGSGFRVPDYRFGRWGDGGGAAGTSSRDFGSCQEWESGGSVPDHIGAISQNVHPKYFRCIPRYFHPL